MSRSSASPEPRSSSARRWSAPSPPYTIEPGPPRADLIEAAGRIRAAYPGRTLTGISNPTAAVPTIRGYLLKGADDYIAIDVHPLTGRLLGVSQFDESFLHWLQHLHFELLAGRTGRILNGIGAALILVMALTGIVIWWPGIARWRQSTKVDFRRRWKRINWDLHSATGFWTAALLLLWTISGIYFAWPLYFGAAVNALSPVTLAKLPPPSRAKTTTPPPDVRRLLAQAQSLSPGATPLSITLPARGRGHIRVFMARETPPRYESADYHFFDAATGRHLLVWHRGRESTFGDLVIAWLGPLHFGTFGGIPVKVLWVILGLAPAVLAVTGLLMYWNRYLGKRFPRLPGFRRQLHPPGR